MSAKGTKWGDGVETGYTALAHAIVKDAVKEYVQTLKKLQRNPENKDAYHKAKSLEKWFKSEWGELLSGLDGEMLIQKINEELL